MKKTILLVLIFVLATAKAFAQTPPVGATCEQMRDWLKTTYYNGKFSQVGYTNSRKKMYADIDNPNDTLTCIYSGYKLRLTRGTQTTNPAPMNCEHSVPQSFFNSAEPMLSDIHHLFPVYGTWNSLRSNYPFAEIPDFRTTTWVYKATSQTTIPTTNIDDYGESLVYSNGTGYFEPREVHKGNCARAVMYFYTMYPTQAGAITSVMSIQQALAWNAQDPPDAAEILRNNKIKTAQGNSNPYVEHPEWAELAWNVNNICFVATDNATGLERVTLSPNPTSSILRVNANTSKNNAKITCVLTDMVGKTWYSSVLTPENTYINANIEVAALPNGIYTLQLQTAEGVLSRKFVKAD